MRHGSRVARPMMVRATRMLRPRISISAGGGPTGSLRETIKSRIVTRRAASDMTEGLARMGPESKLNTHGQLNVRISSQAWNRWDFRHSPGSRSRVRAPSDSSAPGARIHSVTGVLRCTPWTSISAMVVVVSRIADWIRYEHASSGRDGNSGDEQKDGCEAPRCAELHATHLLSHHLDLSKMGQGRR